MSDYLENLRFKEDRQVAKAGIAADEASLVAIKVRKNRDKMISTAADLMATQTAEGRSALSTADFEKFRKATDQAAKFDSLLRTLSSVEKEQRNRSVLLGYEPRTYGPAHPERSYFDDLAKSVIPGMDSRAASERLKRHAKEVSVEAARANRSPEGRRAELAQRDMLREQPKDYAERELRAMSSGSTSGGALVTPTYLVAQWAEFRSPHRSFVDQCTAVPLPEYGLTVYVPSLTSTTSVATQVSENSGLPELGPSGQYLQSSIVSLVGQVTVSQQAYDRGGQPGLAFDQIIGLQLKEQLDAQIDAYVLTQALANAGTVTDTSAFSIANLCSDLTKAREILSDTAGDRLHATHLFTTSDLLGHTSSQLDSSGRPIMTPHFDAQPWNALVAAGDPKGEGWSGHIMPGGLAWFEDNNIPASGSNTQLIVARPQEIIVFEGEPIPSAYPETEAAGLSVTINLRCYVGAIARFPKSVAVIGGSGYPLTLT